jgi:hypothetical protein
MRALSRILVVCALLLAAVLTIGTGGAAAQTDTAEVTAAINALNVNLATHTITSGPIFTPNEAIAFWFDVPSGGAGGFTSASSTGTVHAQTDGSLNVTVSADDWRQLPLSAKTIVAHGISSGVEAVYQIPPTPGLDLTLHLSAAHTLSTTAIFSPSEQMAFWYNLPDGSAAPFNPLDDNTTYAIGDGTLNVTIKSNVWAGLPPTITSIVAHGIRSNLTVVYIFPAK